MADDARETVSGIFDLSDIANEEDTADSDNGSKTDSTIATVSSGLEEVDLVRVVDGDTIIINTAGEDISVRLIGVDTPESVNPDEKIMSMEVWQASIQKNFLQMCGHCIFNTM